MLRALYQDRRHIWTYLVGVLAVVPLVVVGLASMGETDILAQLTRPGPRCSVGTCLGVAGLLLSAVGFLGFLHLLQNRRGRVGYMREINAARAWWECKQVQLWPSCFLSRDPQKPQLWEWCKGDAWVTYTVALITALLFAAGLWLLFPGVTWLRWLLTGGGFVLVWAGMYACGRRVLSEGSQPTRADDAKA